MRDLDYILRFQNGDFDALGALYEDYVNQIFAFILRKTSDREVAEDLTSQVWMKALKGLEKFSERDGATFKSWIYRIAQNSVIDYYRTKREDRDFEDIPEIAFSEDLAECIDNKERLRSVQEFLTGLNPIEQEIVTLRVWDDLSYREIAEITGKKEDNCKQIFKRTITKISANIHMFFVLVYMIL